MLKYIEGIDKTTCYGCTACVAACHFDAIRMIPDNEGFAYPLICHDNCTDCGECGRACPYANEDLFHDDQPRAYALQAKDHKMLEKSSSGAAFALMANKQICDGGWICGCVFDERYTARHIITSKIIDLDRMRGSKYVQSDMGACLKTVESYLTDGQSVMFSGTPCQVAGLRSYLGINYENLITIDLICHGVPSQTLLADYLTYESSKNGKLASFSFRDKTKNGWCSNGIIEWHAISGVKRKRTSLYNDSYYYYYYLADLASRECCYVCPFARLNRVSDLTIGDYWNADTANLSFDCTIGTSIIFANTDKGISLLSELENEAHLVETSPEHAAAGNSNLLSASPRPRDRDNVYSAIANKGYGEAAKQFCRLKPFVPTIKSLIPKQIKLLAKRIKNGR